MRTLALVAASCFAVSRAAAQAAPAGAIELDWLRTPTSPAFTLLDLNPATIARPTTPRALATELVSSTERGTIIPDNYALEFAPYWLRPQPRLTYDQYISPTRLQSFRQSLSVSLATSRDTAAGATQLALGLRALPSAGRVSKKFAEDTALLTRLQDQRLRIQVRLATARTAADSDVVQRLLDRQADSLGFVARRMGKEERVGFFWEMAMGLAAAFPSEDFDAGKLRRVGLWTTMTYRADHPRIDFLGLARFLRNTGTEDQNGLDLGGRIHWALADLGISAEWVSRTAFQVADGTPAPGTTELIITSSSRVVGILDYRAADDLHLTMSFGRDYRELGEDRRPVIARLGMQLSYGDKPVVSAR